MQQLKTFKIEPCLLVRDRLKVDRGVKYFRRDISNETHDDGSESATWETERHYKNRAETALANSVYAKARQRVRSVCISTDIGPICPLRNQGELKRAIQDAKELVDKFNEDAQFCRIEYLVVCTRIEPDNENGVTILRETLEQSATEIRQALMAFDPKKARDVLYATKNAVGVLSDPASQQALSEAQEEARKLCKEMTRLLKEFDGSRENALASAEGEKLLNRANATWNF